MYPQYIAAIAQEASKASALDTVGAAIIVASQL